MNAKITITVPVERLHLTVAGILGEISRELESLSNDVINTSKDVAAKKDLLNQIELLDDTRQKLTLLDSRLEDCYSILGGLVRYKTQEPEEKNVEHTTE